LVGYLFGAINDEHETCHTKFLKQYYAPISRINNEQNVSELNQNLKCHWDQNFGIPYFCIFKNSLWLLVTMPNFNSLRRLEVPFFGRFLSRFCGRDYWPLFRKPASELAEVTLRLTSNLVPSIRLLATGNLTLVQGRFPANRLLYDLEIFVAAAVIKGITCVVQCYNNKSSHRAGISLHQSLVNGPAMEKWIMFVLTHSANFNPRGSDHHGRVFPEGCSCRRIPEVDYSIVLSNYMGKNDPEKTRRKVPNLNAVEVIVCFFFNGSTIVQNLFSFNVF